MLLLLATALATAPPGRKVAPALTDTRYELDGWRLTVRDDRFDGSRRCLLRGLAGTMIYQPGAIGFRVRSRDTLGAVYRVDDGSVIRWQDRYPGLIASGVVVDGPGLDDPTDHLVWVPEKDFVGARTVRVRTGDRGYGQRFRLGAASRMIAAAQGLRCQIVTSL